MGKHRNVISITDDNLTYLQAKDVGTPVFRQVSIKGKSDAEITKQLSLLIKAHKIALHQVTAVISRQNVLVRFMTLPSADVVELKKMVALQIGSIVPYALEEIVFDIQLLGDAGSNQRKVMVIIAPKDVIERQWQIYTKAGVSPSIVSISSMGVWLWYSRRTADKLGVALVLDINEGEVEICLCQHAHLFTSRAFRLPSSDLAADDFKFLLKEIDLTIEGYMKERVGPALTKIITTGSKPIPIDLLTRLQKEYELPVEDIDHARQIKGSNESATALIGFSAVDAAHQINLIPRHLADAHVKTLAAKAAKRMALIMVGLFVIVGVIGAIQVNKKNKYLEELNDQWQVTKKQLDGIEQEKAKINAMSQALNGRVVFAEIFKVVEQSTPPSVSFFNVNINDQKLLSMQGIAKNPADINALQESLMRSTLFVSVQLDFVNKRSTQDGEVSYFKLSCQLK